MKWNRTSLSLLLREDEYSWQGSYENDPLFFLRREKFAPEVLTDLLLGSTNEATAAALLADFLQLTGGLPQSNLKLEGVSTTTSSSDQNFADHNAVIRVTSQAVSRLFVEVKKAEVMIEDSKCSIIFELE